MQATGVTFAVLATLIVAAASSLWSVHCAGADDIPTDYLELPSEQNRYRNVLYEILRRDGHLAGLGPEKMLEALAELSKPKSEQEPEPDTWEAAYARTFHLTMHELGEEGDAACNLNTHQRVYQLISLAKQFPESPILASYMNFLLTIGKAKFAECVAQTEHDFRIRTGTYQGNMVNYGPFHRLENGLDAFYGVYFGAKKPLSDEQLYALAKRVDFANGKFNVRKMLQIAKGYTDRQFHTQETPPTVLLAEFQGYACANIKLGLDEALGQYNIAAALGAPLPNDVPARFLKLNEYRRICLHYNEDKKIDENILRLLEADSGKWYKFGKKN